MSKFLYLIVSISLLIGCVSPIHKQGLANNPLNNLELGQTYGEMVKAIGEPNQSRTEDRSVEEMMILFIPLWNIIESIGDFNPSSIQIYTYTQWGTVTIDNNNHIIRIEAK